MNNNNNMVSIGFIYTMLLCMLTARPMKALTYANGCLLFVEWTFTLEALIGITNRIHSYIN